jgi:hypothetical protein
VVLPKCGRSRSDGVQLLPSDQTRRVKTVVDNDEFRCQRLYVWYYCCDDRIIYGENDRSEIKRSVGVNSVSFDYFFFSKQMFCVEYQFQIVLVRTLITVSLTYR